MSSFDCIKEVSTKKVTFSLNRWSCLCVCRESRIFVNDYPEPPVCPTHANLTFMLILPSFSPVPKVSSTSQAKSLDSTPLALSLFFYLFFLFQYGLLLIYFPHLEILFWPCVALQHSLFIVYVLSALPFSPQLCFSQQVVRSPIILDWQIQRIHVCFILLDLSLIFDPSDHPWFLHPCFFLNLHNPAFSPSSTSTLWCFPL